MRILVVVIYLCAAMIACCVALEFSFTAITIALRNLLSISATSIICSTLISSVASWIPTLLYLPAVFLFGHRIGGQVAPWAFPILGPNREWGLSGALFLVGASIALYAIFGTADDRSIG